MTALVLRTEAQQLLSRHRTAATVAGNLGLAFVAYLGAFLLRFDLAPSWRHWGVLLSTLPLLFCCKALAFWATGLFHDWWRHLGPRDLETIVKGNVLASIAFMVAVVLGPGVAGFPRAVFLIDLILAVSLMTGARVTFRMVRERKERPMLRRIETLALVVGARHERDREDQVDEEDRAREAGDAGAEHDRDHEGDAREDVPLDDRLEVPGT